MAIRTTLRWALAIIATVAIGDLVTMIAVLLVFNTNIGRNVLREEITQQALQRYGMKIELGSLSPHLFPLSLDLNGVTVSSTASIPQVPLLHSTHIFVAVRLFPLLHRKVQLSRLAVDEPVIRLRINAGGRNNFSFTSVRKANSRSSTTETLFNVEISDCSIRAGALFYNDAQVPLDAAFHNLNLSAAYSLVSGEYKGSFAYDRGIWNQGGLEPISHSLQLDFAANSSTFSFSSLRLTTRTSGIALKGQLSNYSDPVIDATYQATVAMRELGATLREPDLPSGTVLLNGTLAYRWQPSHSFLSELALRGHLRSGELVLSDARSLRVLGITANYEMNGANLKVRNIVAEVLGGSLQAGAEFDRLDSPAPDVQMDGSLRELSAAKVSDAFAPPRVQHIPLEGTADLRAHVSWAGPFRNWTRTLVASAHLSVSAPDQPVSAQAIPLMGSVVLDYNGPRKVISFGQSYLQTNNSRISISGTLASGGQNAMVAVNATTENIHEVVAIATIVHQAMQPSQPLAKLPTIGGSATFAGSATGTFQKPRFQGTLTGQKVSIDDTRWRSMRADLLVSPSEFQVRNASLAGDSHEQVEFTGQAGLRSWSVQPDSPISLQVNTTGITITELTDTAKLNESISGAVTAKISVAGTRASPEGTAVVNVTNGSAWNQPFAKLLLDGKFHGGGFHSAVNLQIPAGNVSANVSYMLATEAYTLQLQGTNLQLDRLEALYRKNIHGAANISAQGAGTLNNPSLTANLALPRLEAQGQTISNIAAQLNLTGRNANFSLHSTVDRGSVEGMGEINLGGDYFTSAKLDVMALPVAAVAANFLPAQSSKLGGQTEVHLTVQGPLSDPAAMEAHLHVPSLNVTFGAAQMALAAPLEANYRNGVLTVSNTTIQGTGTNLTFGATIPIRNSKAYSLTANGVFDLSVLHQFEPDVQSQGEIAIHISSQGNTGQPSMRGQLEIDNASFSSEKFPTSIEGLNGAIALSGDRAVITNVSGTVGGGKIAASGSVDLGRETRFALALNAQSVRIRYPQGLRSVLDAQLNAQGTTRNSTLVGRVTVDSLSFTPGFDAATLLASFSEQSGSAPPSPFERAMKLSVAVQSAQNLNLASSRLSVGGDANVNVVGTMDQPVLLGRISLNSGEIFYLGKRFELQSGTIEFANPARTEPVLNLYVSSKLERYDVTMRLTGPAERLRTTYTSDPPISQADIIHLLAFGNTTAEAASQPTSATQSAEAALAQGVSSPLTGKLQSLAGISQLSIDPLANNAYGDPGAEIAIQERVTGSLLLTFSTNVTTTQNQAASLRYDVNKQLSVTILRDQNGGYGVDVRLHKAF